MCFFGGVTSSLFIHKPCCRFPLLLCPSLDCFTEKEESIVPSAQTSKWKCTSACLADGNLVEFYSCQMAVLFQLIWPEFAYLDAEV